jgi:anthranilate phosphoribosyltransferase
MLDGKRSEYELDPGSLGLPKADPGAVRGGTPPENAAIAREVLDGARGPRRDVVLLNAAAALRAAGQTLDWREGLELAAAAIDKGEAGQVLERWIGVSHSAAAPAPA